MHGDVHVCSTSAYVSVSYIVCQDTAEQLTTVLVKTRSKCCTKTMFDCNVVDGLTCKDNRICSL